MRIFLMITILVTAGFIGCDRGSGPMASDDGMPTGPAPAVGLSMAFDDSPLEGFVELWPPEGSSGWGYSVDLNEDGVWDRQGRLDRGLGWAFRFEDPGVHLVRVRLDGPAGSIELERFAIVNDPTGVEILATGQAPHLNADAFFEGITATGDGGGVYVGDFWNGAIFRIDPSDLVARDTVVLSYGLEGLSVSPSGAFLFAGTKYPLSAYRFSLPDLTPASPPGDWGQRLFFVHALDDEHALYTGLGTFIRNVPGEVVTRRVLDGDGIELTSGPMAVSRDGTLAAIVDRRAGALVRLYSLPGAILLRDLRLPDGEAWIESLAFGPAAEQLYIRSSDALFVVDASRGEIIGEFRLELSGCSSLCVANPSARSKDGRFLAFEGGEGVLIVDTDRRIPLYRIPGHASVAQDPASPAGFFLLDTGGGIRRIAIGG
jgi:hypothetical protein